MRGFPYVVLLCLAWPFRAHSCEAKKTYAPLAATSGVPSGSHSSELSTAQKEKLSPFRFRRGASPGKSGAQVPRRENTLFNYPGYKIPAFQLLGEMARTYGAEGVYFHTYGDLGYQSMELIQSERQALERAIKETYRRKRELSRLEHADGLTSLISHVPATDRSRDWVQALAKASIDFSGSELPLLKRSFLVG